MRKHQNLIAVGIALTLVIFGTYGVSNDYSGDSRLDKVEREMEKKVEAKQGLIVGARDKTSHGGNNDRFIH